MHFFVPFYQPAFFSLSFLISGQYPFIAPDMLYHTFFLGVSKVNTILVYLH
ncbi:hypothetical protein Bbad01_14070 [Bacillus badius]|nr:hypothetical protein Bbad01_14070 [Bacillus badius]